MIFFFGFIVFVIIQRIIELVIARRHRKLMLGEGAVEYDKGGYKYIVMMHVTFFVFMTVEFFLFNRSLNKYWIIFIVLFFLAQVLRYWAIASLGKFWNTQVLVLKGSKLVKSGPYRFMRHPNYLVVVIEIAVIPLMFSCYLTAAIFTVMNLFLLKRRISVEEKALELALN